jgi:hypothetical protein
MGNARHAMEDHLKEHTDKACTNVFCTKAHCRCNIRSTTMTKSGRMRNTRTHDKDCKYYKQHEGVANGRY